MFQRFPKLCYVTDRRSLSTNGSLSALLPAIRSAIEAGADWIQLREKDLSARDLFRVAAEAVAAATPSARVSINDRLDVALAAQAAGVHLGVESIEAGPVIKWLRAAKPSSGFLVGISCHRLDEVVAAQQFGADYAFFGPVFATPSKVPYGAPHGIARLAEVCRRVHIPVLAIGGINAENMVACLEAGAAGIAAIRLFQDKSDVSTLRQVLSRARQHF